MTTQTMPCTQVWDKAIFDGNFRKAGHTLDVVAPGSGQVIATVGQATEADLDLAVQDATEAQKAWAALPYTERARVLRKAAAILAANPQRMVDWIVPETGGGAGKAAHEVATVIAELEEAANQASLPYGEVLRSKKERFSYARKVPVGVVGVISPFNFPGILSIRSVAPALALGNAVILKPDPRTPITGGLFFAELFTEAGLPKGLLHVLPGGAEVGKALVAHPGVPCISFTGSTAAGRAIGQAAGPLLKKVHLELGGNNSMLVLPDADVEAAASVGAWGSYLHQGQICMTTGRHIVHRSLVDQYAAILAQKANNIPVGDPEQGFPLGPIIDESQRDKVHSIVTETVEAGATLAAGGTYDGLFYRPTVLTNVPTASAAWTREIFGPVAPIVAYDTLDEAIELINDTEYGLTVSIITSNPFAAVELADRIETGAVHINDSSIDDEPIIPFGGAKASGSGGRFGGGANLDTFMETQWITVQSQVQAYPF